MESIKTERKIARSLFTKSKNDLSELLKSDSPDNEAVETEYQYFMEKAENLFRVEERVKEQWLNMEKLDEALFMKDMDTAEAYKKDWINLKVKYEKLYKVQQKESNYEDASNSITQAALMKKLRLPKLEMPKFDGNAKNWISFWSIFKKIHNDDSIDNDDKFAYLLQSIEPESPAKALVGSFPPCGINYHEAIKQLKARYARDELLIEIYVRELLSLVLQQAKGENMSVAILYDRLKTQLRALESSMDSKEEAERFIAESKHVMSEGKFELRGWITSPIRCVGTEEEAEISVLGMKWDTKTDELYCHVEDLKSFRKTITKRGLLSIVHKIFDPIGIICPATVTPKMLLQKTWNLKLTWDAELPEEIRNEYEKWLQHIHLLRECRIKRRLSKVSFNKCNKSLHVFCDASSKAFAACIFIRTEMDGDVDVELVMAKARVAPVKKISIPRLELIAALMATRLYRQVQEALALEDCDTYFWSDSSVAITWITSDGDWSTFVKNRVREIRENTNRKDWQHISGSQNPADLPSRGCHGKKLVEERWWEGPAWLRLESTEWPIVSDFERDDVTINSERKKPIVCLESISEDFSLQFNNLSNYMKILRTMAWVKRFIRNCRAVTRDKENLGEKEIEDAEIHLFKLIQKADPCESTCKKGALEIIEDGEGLKRVKTRLTLGDYNEDFKCPIILPGKHKIVEKLIYFKHRKKLHAGLNILSSELRNNLWIVGAKRAIRRVISTCMICKRFTARKYETPDPPLPRNRIKESATFQVTGIDAAGPLFLKTGEKCYIILFTCAVYRAVHLELVMFMSTESFIMALRRFIARRGRCQTIYTDNGSNFKGAETQFSNLNWDQIKEVERIQWIFNPPAAPWWGGWWERLIQSIKQLLRRNLGKSTLSYIELQTLLCDIESLINARPLTYITEGDPWQPLTPAMFLNTLPSAEVPDLDAVDAANLNVRLNYLQKLRQDLRHRFTKEYLSLLVCRSRQSACQVQVGDIVLVETEARRMRWPLGIVTAVFSGKDGVGRVAVVKTADGERTRPVQRLYQLEATGEGVRPPAAAIEAVRKTTSGRPVRAPRRLDL